MLCGLVCGGAESPAEAWLEQLMPPTDPGDHSNLESRQVLREYALPIEKTLLDPDLSFELPIPDDSSTLRERATAFHDWVRGFLFALGVLSISERRLSEQGREILDDLVAMTRLDLADLDETEENEQALSEVTEYMRVAAMLIREECVGPGDVVRSA